MKKTVRTVLSLMLAMLLTAGMAMVGLASDEAATVEDIAGTYLLDATPLGMPLQVYILIHEDGTFNLTNKLEDGDDKGSGRVGGSDGTFMFLYSDSTNETPKTATFTVEGKKLVFSTSLPYGSSSFAPNESDAGNVIYPEAKAIVYEEYLGTYGGTYEKDVEAMGTTITYNYMLTLSYGAEYTFESLYSVMGEDQVFTQSGTFSIDGTAITITAEGETEETAGTLAEDGSITLPMQLSPQAQEKTEISLEKATTAEYAGSYTGRKTLSMGMVLTTDASLELDNFGGYSYTAKIEGEDDYVEAGTFSVENGTVTFVSEEEGTEPVEGTLGDYVLTAEFKISSSVPMATEIVFYASQIQGTFTAQSDGDAGYTGTLTLQPDGSYQLSVTKDGTETYAETGTFRTEGSAMGVSLLMTSEDGMESSGVISDASININHPVDDTQTPAGFQYSKAQEEANPEA